MISFLIGGLVDEGGKIVIYTIGIIDWFADYTFLAFNLFSLIPIKQSKHYIIHYLKEFLFVFQSSNV